MIEAHSVKGLDEAAKLLAEADENECRRPFTPAEARALYAKRKELLAAAEETNGNLDPAKI